MKFIAMEVPRVFKVGKKQSFTIKDCGNIQLNPDEQVTFSSPQGKQYDVTAKSWGYYATPSVNGRLRDQGFKTALVKNTLDRHFIMIVDKEKIDDFIAYLLDEENE